MGVQNDARELLRLFYDELINKRAGSVDTQKVIDEKKWNGDRIDRAFNYLKRLNNTIGFTEELGDIGGAQKFSVDEILPNGINILESKPIFKKTFGLEFNAGIVKASLGLTEK